MADYGKNLAITIINRIKEVENVKYDKDLALLLKVSDKSISAYKKRDSIPLDVLIPYSRKHKVSLEWLINDRGPKRSGQMLAEEGAIYHVETDQDVVYDIAAQVHAALQGVEVAPDKFSQVVKLLHREYLGTNKPQTTEKINEVIKLIL